MAQGPFLHFESRVRNWRSYVPLLDTIKNYRKDDAAHDLVAGLVLGVITVPQAIAYAYLAGLPPQAGLYACLAPMLLYAILGSSRHLVVGPVAVAALMVAAAIGEYAPRYSNAYLGISTVLCVQAGIILLLLRVTQMGGIVNLLSHPVITGFINAAAILIIISQLPGFTGIVTSGVSGPLDELAMLMSKVGELNIVSLAIGVTSLVMMWLLGRYLVGAVQLVWKNLKDESPLGRTGPMIAVILATFMVIWLNLDGDFDVATVGFVPPGLPAFTMPPFEISMWLDLLPSSAMIALVAYVESYSVGTSIAIKERTRINSHQELIALGAANISAAFTGAYPVAGSFSRSSVNYQAGARSQVSSLFCMAVIVVTLLFLTPLFERLPQACLAAIVTISVANLIDFRSIMETWSIYRQDAMTETATLATVLLFGVEAGLLTGVALSVAFFIRLSSRPHVTLVGRIINTEHFRAVKRYDTETLPHVVALRIDENIYFANSNQIENRLQKTVQRRPATRHVLLVCNAVNMIDISGLQMLRRFNDNLLSFGIKLHLSEVKGPVIEALKSGGFPTKLSGSIYFTTHQAMRDLEERV
ncbi:MAG: sulfate permease [Proteobacteria bacterium]|nr:sulfate permease [Pseudomonadota bacterium]